MTETNPTIATFRPDDERLTSAVEYLESRGIDPLPDPMLAIEETGTLPRTDADYVVITSKTGVDILTEARWDTAGASLVAIGEPTAEQLRTAGYTVDLVPEEYTSSGIVQALADAVDGTRVEVARSDHGSEVLMEGLRKAGGYVHETILYRLVKPDGAGGSAAAAAEGDLDGALFTSSLQVEHFLEAAAEQGIRDEALAGLEDAVVGAIGPPTRRTAEAQAVDVDLVPDEVTFEALADAVIDQTTE